MVLVWSSIFGSPLLSCLFTHRRQLPTAQHAAAGGLRGKTRSPRRLLTPQPPPHIGALPQRRSRRTRRQLTRRAVERSSVECNGSLLVRAEISNVAVRAESGDCRPGRWVTLGRLCTPHWLQVTSNLSLWGRRPSWPLALRFCPALRKLSWSKPLTPGRRLAAITGAPVLGCTRLLRSASRICLRQLGHLSLHGLASSRGLTSA